MPARELAGPRQGRRDHLLLTALLLPVLAGTTSDLQAPSDQGGAMIDLTRWVVGFNAGNANFVSTKRRQGTGKAPAR